MAASKGFANLDDEDIQPEDSVGVARIKEAGIHDNIQFMGVMIEKFKGKKDKTKEYIGAKFSFKNEAGEVHDELYFQPPPTVDDMPDSDWTPDKYEKLPGDSKSTKTGKLSKEKYWQVLNNDYAFFLLDLAEALGFKFDAAKALITKADNFEDATKVFRDKFCKDLEKKRISMKLLWANNTKDKTSFLRLHDFIVYYPFKNDIFDTYGKERKTVLFISDFENTNKMKQKFQNERRASGAAVTAGETSSSSYTQSDIEDDNSAEPDPF